jgi:hypothetical protein
MIEASGGLCVGMCQCWGSLNIFFGSVFADPLFRLMDPDPEGH